MSHNPCNAKAFLALMTVSRARLDQLRSGSNAHLAPLPNVALFAIAAAA